MNGAMKLLLVFVAACCTPTAFGEEVRTSKWSYVFTALSKSPTADNAEQANNALVSAIGGSLLTCNPGWTGQFCESPICSSRGTVTPPNQSIYGQLVDMVSLPKCAGSFQFPYDSLSDFAYINVQSDGGAPVIVLTDSNGTIVGSVEATGDETQYHVFYRKLLPGTYSVSVRLTIGQANYCAVDVNAFSDVSIRTGFVSPAQNDFPPDDRHGNADERSFFVAHAFNLPYPGGLSTVIITEDGSDAYRAVLGKRYACVYENFAGWFTCKAGSTYMAKLDGIDYNGNPLRRSLTFRCLQGVTTQAPTTTSPPPISQCLNGGTLLYANSPEAYCYCPVLFTGRSCENALCMNGGSPNQFGTACICLEGFTGPNCQNVNCTLTDNIGLLTDQTSLVFVVRASTSMAANIRQIAGAASAVIDAYNRGGTNVFRTYVLVSFVNGTVQVQNFFASGDSDLFISALINLASNVKPGDCTDNVMDAVSSTFESFILTKSPIFVFTDAYPNDYQAFFGIFNRNANIKFPIYFITITPTPESGCVNDPFNPGNRAMQTVAAYTQALSMAVDSTSPNLGNMIQGLLFGTTFGMNPVYSNDLQQCSRQPNFQAFFADSSATSIHFLATGVGLQLSVIDPNGVVVNPALQFQLGNTYGWHLTNPVVGQYLLQLSSSQSNTPCSYRVLARSNYDFFYSSSPGLIFDAGFSEPVYNNARHIVAVFNGEPIIDPYRQFAEITIYGNDFNDVRQSLYMSSGTYRSGCTYKMYFGAYNCRTPEQLLYITVYADDNLGNTIQRSAVGYCAAIEPTNLPPNSCLNGGVANPTNSTPCLCPPQFSGNFCQSIICQNGGTGSSGICVCPPGTVGQFCEINSCIVTATGINFDPNGRSLIFVLSVRASMQAALTAIANNVGEMVRDIQIASPNWIRNYMIIAFNETMVTVLKNNSDPQSFVSGMQAAATYPSMGSGGADCSVMLASALQLALQNSFMNSYVFAFTDSNAQTSTTETRAMLSLLGLAERTRATINVITTSTPICGPDPNTKTGLAGAIEEIIAYSGGDIYNTDDTGNFMKFIPTFYDSGLTYINYQDDCSSKNLTIYFPVDGWTQSFTAAIYGTTPSITVYRPDGNSTYLTYYNVPVIEPSSTAPNLLLRQTIIPCGEGSWANRDPYCYKVEYIPKNWTTGRDFCHQSMMMGFMSDVHSSDVQSFLDVQTGSVDYWIGLNSLKTQGQWEWDVPDGAAYSHLDGYTNWAPGEPANDPNLRCVQVRHSGSNVGVWYAADCAQTFPYFCQKHRYGQGLSPGELDVNLLPQGMWRADISTASGSCYVQVRAQSQIQPYYGFVQDIHSDQPDQYGIFNSQSNRLAATVTGLSAINANSPSGTVNYAFMYKGNFSMNRAVTFEQRALCAYQFVSQPFTCPGQNINPNFVIDDFFIKFSGVDQFGNLYERFSPAYCLKQVIANCNNGGTQYQGVCICPPYFTGPTCSVRVCQNGGGLSSDGTTCTCRTGFTGGSCEFPLCLPPYPATFHNNGKTLAIVLETSYSTGAAVFRLRRNLNAVLNQVLNVTASTWFSNFILYPFDSTTNMANWYAPGVYTTVDALTNAFMNITPSQCPGAAACSSSCPRPIMTALNATLNYPDLATPNSQVLIITQSSPEDYAVVDQVLTQIQQTGVKVSVLVTDTQSPCAMGFNSTQGRALFSLAGFSGGSVFQVSSFELTGAFMTSYLPTLYSAAIISGGFAQNCSSQLTYIQVDQNMTDFTLDAFGANVQVALTGPNGPVALPSIDLLSSSFNYFQVVGTNLLQGAGIYTLSVSAAGSECSVQVRGGSPLETFIAYTQVTDQYNGATQDDAHYAPVSGQQNVIMVHARGLTRGRLSYVEIASDKGLVFTSPLARRSNCSYEFYSTNSFPCNLLTFIIAVHGYDDFGLNFRRLAIGHCVDTRPIPSPPPAFCDLKQRKLDLVFILDASMPNSSFQVVKTFVKTLLIAYNINGNFTQIGLMTVAATAQPKFMLITSQNGGVPALVDPVPWDGSNGQNMTAALTLLTSTFTQQSNGYRNDAQHLAIYITSNAGFTDGDPIQQANTIRRSGSWGIATVGYGILSGANAANNLIELAGGNRCSYRSGNPTDLNTNGLNFLQSRTCFDGQLCSS